MPKTIASISGHCAPIDWEDGNSLLKGAKVHFANRKYERGGGTAARDSDSFAPCSINEECGETEMNINDVKDDPTGTKRLNGEGTQAAPAKAVSARKIEANRQNAQRSTGPKTPEGKTKSSQNSVTHGIFVKQFLNGATPETIEEMKALTTGLREHYQPVGMMEEILLQKILVETARYGRILGLEQRELARENAFFSAAVDRVGRYTTSTSRGLFHAIEQLERLQDARKANECSAAPSDQESADQESVGVAAKNLAKD
jgi:hypothetical protein